MKFLGCFLHFSVMLMVVAFMSMFISCKVMFAAAIIVAVVIQIENDDGFNAGIFTADIIGALAGLLFGLVMGL